VIMRRNPAVGKMDARRAAVSRICADDGKN
jgi:hypothetical protein